MPDYDPIRDELIPICKDIEEHLGNLMSAQTRALERTADEKEMSKTLTTLTVQVGAIITEIKAFSLYQHASDSRQRELENKVTRLMAYGVAGVTVMTFIVHWFGK